MSGRWLIISSFVGVLIFKESNLRSSKRNRLSCARESAYISSADLMRNGQSIVMQRWGQVGN